MSFHTDFIFVYCAVDNFQLKSKRAELYGLIGPNSCRKTNPYLISSYSVYNHKPTGELSKLLRMIQDITGKIIIRYYARRQNHTGI